MLTTISLVAFAAAIVFLSLAVMHLQDRVKALESMFDLQDSFVVELSDFSTKIGNQTLANSKDIGNIYEAMIRHEDQIGGKP